MIILIAKLDERLKNFKSTYRREQTAEQNIEKKNCSRASTFNDVFIILTKRRCIVRSGIRTHAYKSRLRPERSALDRSAILTHSHILAQTLVRKESHSRPQSLQLPRGKDNVVIVHL